MINLIKELLNPGDAVTLYLTGEIEPLRARFVKIADQALVVRVDGGICVVKFDSVYRFVVPETAISAHEEIEKPQHTEYQAIMADPEETEETKEAEEIAANAEAEQAADADSDSFSPIFVPKVVGRIDLDAIVDPRRKRYSNSIRPTEENPLVPAGGTVNSIGPAFGFITATNGEALFFSRGEIMQRNRGEEIHKGMPVIFTPERNNKGGVAKCVHVQMTVQEQLEWIEKIEQYDPRNARLLATQLLMAFPDDSELADTLSTFDIKPYQNQNSYSRIGVPVAEKTLAAVSHGHYVDPADLLKAEQEIAATKPYEEAFEQISQLLDFAMTNSRQHCYQLFVRLGKLSRNNGDMPRMLETIDRAIEFYNNDDESVGAKAYFEKLRQKFTTDPVTKACDTIMSSQYGKTNVAICGESVEATAEVMDKIHERLAGFDDCVCGRLDLNKIEIDSQFERNFFYQLLCSISEAVGKKFDTEFQIPDREKITGEDVSEFAARIEVSEALKTIRTNLESAHLHIVCVASDFDRVVKGIGDGIIGENFMRHYIAVAESGGINLQLVADFRPPMEEFTSQQFNKDAFRKFTIINI